MEEKELKQKVEDGLFPEINPVRVEIRNGWEIEITALPVLDVMKLNRKLEPFYRIFQGGFDGNQLLDANFIEKHYKEMLDAAWFIVQYHSKKKKQYDGNIVQRIIAKIKSLLFGLRISRKYLGESCDERVLLKIIYSQLEVNGHVNFFKLILKGVIQMLAMGSFPSTQS